jgi:excisionase family DNA binding protein
VNALPEPLAYTDAEVSSLLRVSKRSVYRLRKSGALQTVRIGRAVRILSESLKQFMERAGRQEQLRTNSADSSQAESRNGG